MAEHNAIQENFRSTAKEIQTRIGKLMATNQDVPAEKMERLIELERFFNRVGRGEVRPGTALLELPERFGANLNSLVEGLGASFEMLIKDL